MKILKALIPAMFLANTIFGQNNSIDKYVKDIQSFGDDTTKNTLYIIPQIHHVSNPGEKLGDTTVNKITDDVLEVQKNIYRIIENLNKNENLELICSEGTFYNDYHDINKPNFLIDNASKKGKANLMIMKSEIEKGNDTFVYGLIRSMKRGGASMYASLYPDLFMTGFETKDWKETYNNAHNKPIHKDSSYYDDIVTKRSNAAINSAITHSDNLYKKGIIENKDVAIIIGKYHVYSDYLGLIINAAENKIDWNVKIITPKGVPDYK